MTRTAWCLQGYYFSGDGCRRDEDGYYWITGRVDDVINVSGCAATDFQMSLQVAGCTNDCGMCRTPPFFKC